MVFLLCWMAVNQFECHKIILCAIYLCVSKFFAKITLAWKDKIELAQVKRNLKVG